MCAIDVTAVCDSIKIDRSRLCFLFRIEFLISGVGKVIFKLNKYYYYNGDDGTKKASSQMKFFLNKFFYFLFQQENIVTFAQFR